MSAIACSGEALRAALAARFEQAPARLSLLAGWAQRDEVQCFRSGEGFAVLEPAADTLVTDAWPAPHDEALLAQIGHAPRKIIAAPAEARRLAAAAASRFGLRTREAMRLGCYRLARLRREQDVCPGRLRPASLDEVAMLEDWDEAMATDAKLGQTEASLIRGLTRLSVERGRRRIWDDAGARCSLGFVPVGKSWRILLVYTPPPYRGQHYATAAVAALCRELQEAGADDAAICLYADLDNPTSNHLYRGIGFVLEGEQLSIELV